MDTGCKLLAECGAEMDQDARLDRRVCPWVRLCVTAMALGAVGLFPLQAGGQLTSVVRINEEMRLDGEKESFSVVAAAAAGPDARLAVWFPHRVHDSHFRQERQADRLGGRCRLGPR